MKLRKLANNVTELLLSDGTQVLISYETPVAAYRNVNGGTYYRTTTKWSATTNRHINNWLPDNQVSPVIERDQAFFDELLKVA